VELSTIAPYVVFPPYYPTAIDELYKPPFWQNMFSLGRLNIMVIFPVVAVDCVEKLRDDAFTVNAFGIQQLDMF